MKKLIIKAQINDYEMRNRNPNVPWSARNRRGCSGVPPCRGLGATGRIAVFLDVGILQGTVYLPFHLTSGGMLADHPGTKEGLDLHLELLPEGRAIEWVALNLHGSILPLDSNDVAANARKVIKTATRAFLETLSS